MNLAKAVAPYLSTGSSSGGGGAAGNIIGGLLDG
jgi:hypothetical protein